MEWDNAKIENRLSSEAIGFAMKIHTKLGPGLLESAYRECLVYELRKARHNIETEKSMPLVYEEIKLEKGYRMDILIDERLVIEVKSVDTLTDVHFAQVLTYLRLGGYRLGLLLNFRSAHLRDGIRRIANNL